MGLRSLPTLLLQTLDLITSVRPRVLNIGANLTLTDGPNSGEATLAATGGGGSPAFVGCQVYNSSDQSIANNTLTALSFNSEGYDTDGIHEGVTHPTRFTIPSGKDGYWTFKGMVDWAGNSAGFRYIELDVNGGSFPNISQQLYILYPNTAPFHLAACFSIDIPVVAGDYVEINVQQTSGGSLNINNAGTGNVWGGTFVQCRFLGA